MIYSYELEMQLLAGLIKYPEKYCEIANFISEEDFWNDGAKLNRVVFSVLRQAIENNENIDSIVLGQRVKSLGISFENNIDVADYIDSLSLRQVSRETIVTTAKELKKITVRRGFYQCAAEIGKKMRTMPASADYSEIITSADQIYNNRVNLYETGADSPVDLYEKMEDIVEERGNNPITEFGFVGPYPKLQDVYGSLLRPGNITVIVARSGVGKELANYSKILTPDGWTTHGKVKVGDKVLCPDGKTANVTGVFPQGKKQIFRVYFEDGRFVDSGAKHLWRVKLLSGKNWTTQTTEEILAKLEAGDGAGVPLSKIAVKKDFKAKIEEILKSEIGSETSCVSFVAESAAQAQELQQLVWQGGGVCTVSEKKYCILGELQNITGATKKKMPVQDCVYISSIEKLDQKENCTCIMIDHPDHLYITDNYIVTHNTQLSLDFISKVSFKYNVPILHFDNGEMSEEETIMRQCAALSGVPFHLLETGNWRKAGEDVVKKVRSVWDKIKQNKLFYYNVGGMNVDSQINLLKRFYYSQVGRGNPLIFNFDYIKTTYENTGAGKQEWQVVGEMVDKYKKCIQRELKTDKGPHVSMWTSVQSNRAGIVSNRQSSNVVDDESIVSLSDRITHFASHLFVLRPKTADELQTEKGFGTHKLIPLKARHLGRDIDGAINPVKMPDGSLKKNFFNLEFNNFSISEKGDLRDVAESMDANSTLSNDSHGADDAPDFDKS